MADLARSVSPSTVGRGEVLTVELLDTDGFRGVRVELVLVERRLRARFDVTTKHTRTVAEVDAVEGSDSVELPVPTWVPDSFYGDEIAVSYEAHVIGDRAGPDSRQVFAINVRGGCPVDVRASGYTDARAGRPMAALPGFGTSPELYGLGRVYDTRSQWFLTGIFVAVSLSVVVGAVVAGNTAGVVVGGIALALSMLLAGSIALRRRLPIDDIEVRPPHLPLRMDEPVVIELRSPPDPSVEIGIEALELFVTPGGDRRSTQVSALSERFVPFTDSTITIAALPGDLAGYAGRTVSLHWVVSLRMVDTPESRRHALTRRIPIARIP